MRVLAHRVGGELERASAEVTGAFHLGQSVPNDLPEGMEKKLSGV